MGANQPPPLPVFYEYVAARRWRAIDLISDLHLGTDTPLSFDAFAAHLLHTPAEAVLILGDLFEVWIGDDVAQSEAHPFERRCVEVMAEAASRRQIAFLPGNRDFLVGARMLRETGAMGLPDPTVLVAWGQRLLLTHGDALCLDDHDYQRFRAEVRSPVWREAFLARPLRERARLARDMRQSSEARKRGLPDPSLWADVDTTAAVAWMHAAGAPLMIHGHTHRPGVHNLAPGYQRQVLSDWDLDGADPRAQVLRLTRDGLQRIAPATASTTSKR
jgi:UDP-2,3-diacylglucosamine hydrolase